MKSSAPTKKIGFCFLAHQAHTRHQLPIAAQLSFFDDYIVELIVTTQATFSDLQNLLLQYPGHNCTIRFISGTKIKTWVGHLKGRLYPNIRNVINHNKALFLSYNILVTPHANLDAVFKLDKSRNIKYVCTFHGAGDGDIGFDIAFANYDLLLASGADVDERLRFEGVIHEKNTSVIIGYPKYDLVNTVNSRLFNNDNAVFVYNPHYAKDLTSWSLFGQGVLDFFANNSQYNLVFAPHIKMFDGHMPSELNKYLQYSNIIVDINSNKLVDATYTKGADVYIGDVSSQVYEFLYFALKPTIFLNAFHEKPWENNPSLQMWKTGTVVNEIRGFSKAIASAQKTHIDFIDVQRGLIARKFSKTDVEPGLRGAQAIVRFMF
ncbi:MAG: hypothetical protein RPS47_05230 [Colwellia sp.]